MPDTSNRRAVVTGGTKGIGAAITARLAADGYSVVAAARSAPREPLPDNVRFIAADLLTPAGVTAFAEQALAHLGGVDLVVDNAGGNSATAAGAEHITDEDWAYNLDLNLLAAVRLDRALLPGMRTRQHGVIVHISSICGVVPIPNISAYSTAKAALNAYSKALATEVAGSGIRVNRSPPDWCRPRPWRSSRASDPAPPSVARPSRRCSGTRGTSRPDAWAGPRRSPPSSPTWPRPRPRSSPARTSGSTAAPS